MEYAILILLIALICILCIMFYIIYNIVSNIHSVSKLLGKTVQSSNTRNTALATALDVTSSLVANNCELVLIKYVAIARRMYEMTKKPKDLVIVKEAEAALFEHKKRLQDLNKVTDSATSIVKEQEGAG